MDSNSTKSGAPSALMTKPTGDNSNLVSNGVSGGSDVTISGDDTLQESYNWDKDRAEEATVPSFRELFRRNWHPTLVYCGVFWSFGMCVAFLGPTLLDLGCQTSTDLRRISWVFFCQLFATLLGSIIAGVLVQRYFFHLHQVFVVFVDFVILQHDLDVSRIFFFKFSCLLYTFTSLHLICRRELVGQPLTALTSSAEFPTHSLMGFSLCQVQAALFFQVSSRI